MLKFFKITNLCLATFLLIVLGGVANADTIVRGFLTRDKITLGYVVALAPDNFDYVELAPANDTGRIYGVVVDPATAPVVLETPPKTTYVATGGSFDVLTSTQRGEIKKGDYLTLSTSDGIAAKASPQHEYIIGQAEQDFNGSSGVEFRDKNQPVGKVKTKIVPGFNPLSRRDPAVTRNLKQAASSLVGKSVTSARIYAAMAIFILSVALSVGLVWVGVRTSIISIGRNPLSKHLIMRGLTRAILIAVLIFSGGLATIYLLFKI